MKIVMTGGGTGGHIYPALTIADKIKRKHPDAEILFVGAERGIERDLVPRAGYDIELINVRGFYRKYLWKNPAVIKDLFSSMRKARKILKKFKADIVIGTGGYVSGPVLREAHKAKLPIYIHEQNAYPGLANRLGERYAKKIFLGFKEAEPYFKDKDKLIYTGNPVRKEFITSSILNSRAKLGISEKDLMVLSFGGSGGSAKINDTVAGFIENNSETENLSIYMITGKSDYPRMTDRLKGLGPNVKIIEYADNMHELFGAADIIVCRSGAITLAEITVSGRAAILIPSPNVTGDHQYHNAKALEDKGAAIIINEKDLSSEKLETVIRKLSGNRELLNTMNRASADMGRTDAVDIIYENLDLKNG